MRGASASKWSRSTSTNPNPDPNLTLPLTRTLTLTLDPNPNQVALNFQTWDLPMRLNHARFVNLNGGCRHVQP